MIHISKELEALNQSFVAAQEIGVIKAVSTGDHYDGHKVTVRGQEAVFFGNCSYMGLDQNEEIKEAAKEGIDRYGMYFSSSRSFMGLEIFEQMEESIEKMYGQPVNITTSTTFAHVSNFPILLGKEDAVILDLYVHSSLQTAINITRNSGIHVEYIRHSRIDLLEERIKELKEKHRNVWYMIDGVYSMMGDSAPMKDIKVLLDKYEQFHVYADDAHGTSWTGKNGVGYVLNEMGQHEKLYLGLSMAKGFGVGGGLMVYPNRETKELVKTLGTNMVFSGPPHPGVAAAAIKSAEIHMRAEFADWQLELKQKIEYFWKKANQLNLPLSGDHKTPIFYVVLGSLENVFFASKYLVDHGAFVDTCSFPSVPMNKSGLRMTISRFITIEDIDNVLNNLNDAYTQLEQMGQADREKMKKLMRPKQASVLVS